MTTSPLDRFTQAYCRRMGTTPTVPGVMFCPAHEDKHKPSLSVSVADDGRLLFKCFAGCSFSSICESLEFPERDAFDSRDRHSRNGQKRAKDSSDGNATQPDWAAIASAIRSDDDTLRPHAAELHISIETLRRFGVGSIVVPKKGGGTQSAWAWPMRDGGGNVCGLRLRQGDDKWCCRGSKQGVFIPSGINELRGTTLLVAEGATDAAALVDAGFAAIGLPAAGQGIDYLRKFVASQHPSLAVLVGDNDTAGHNSAVNAAAALASIVQVKIIFPPDGIKDIRAWLTGGGTAADVQAAIDSAEVVERESTTPAIEQYEPFPLDVLPARIARFVRATATAMCCDVALVALPLFVAMAAAIGNSRRIRLKHSWSEPAIIWIACVAYSGDKKSPPLEAALRAYRRHAHRLMKKYRDEWREYVQRAKQYRRDMARWMKKNDGGEPPKAPDPPICQRTWSDDVTVEALAVLLRDNPRGMLVAKDELSGLFGGMDRYAQRKGGDAAKWIEMHGGRAIMVDRKTGENRTIYVPRAAVCVAGTIQPGTLRAALTPEHRANGLAARLLFAMPPRRAQKWTDADVSKELEEDIEAVIDRLFTLEPEKDEDGDPRPVLMAMTSAGKAVFTKFYDEHAAERADLDGDLAAAWSKLEGYAARFALVIHFARWAVEDPTLGRSDAVDEVSVAAGVRLSRWFAREARRVYGMLGESDFDRDQRLLVEWIERKGGSVTARQVKQCYRPVKDMKTEEIEARLGGLVKSGHGEWEPVEPGDGGGRPTRVFVLSTKPIVYETSKNAGENGSSVDVDAVDARRRTGSIL